MARVPSRAMSMPESVGKYRPIAAIGEGGMAKVFLAVAHGPANFNKLIALKLLRPHVAEDEELAEMFFEEARIAARLSHPNVVQTYDVGAIDDQYFIAMEYLQGQPLSALHAKSHSPPREMLLRILADALGGLHYAHELTDLDGGTLTLVHRDVSPHNIFVTYDGQVKVLDFGIAKSLAREGAATRSGVVKGKIGYMAPEQVTGEEPDRRTDVFAAGVILWEMLAGRRMWRGIQDVTIMLKLVNEGVPSLREVCPDVPAELLDICDRALAQDKNFRYSSAAEFQAAIEGYLDASGARIRTRDIGQFIAEAFASAKAQTAAFINERQKQIRELGDAFDPRASGPNLATSTETPKYGRLIPALPGNEANTGSTADVIGVIAAKRRARMVTIGAAAAVAAILLGTLALRRSPAPSGSTTAVTPAVTAPAATVPGTASTAAANTTPRAKVQVVSNPEGARLFIDSVEVGHTPFALDVPADRTSHEIRAELPGYGNSVVPVTYDGSKVVTLLLRREAPVARGVPRYTAPSAPKPAATAAAPASATPVPAATATPPKRPTRQLDNDNPFER